MYSSDCVKAESRAKQSGIVTPPRGLHNTLWGTDESTLASFKVIVDYFEKRMLYICVSILGYGTYVLDT